MRSNLIALIVLGPVLGIINSIWFGLALKRFLAEVPRIIRWHDLEMFKRVVARQMYAALFQLVFLVSPFLVWIVGKVLGVLTASDILYVIPPSIVVVGLGIIFKKTEKKVQSLPVDDEELLRERDRIVETWLKKPLPDW